MKHSRTCPKCSGKKIWVIAPLRHESENLGGRGMVVALLVSAGFMKREVRVGSIDAHVCAACGYTELWSRDFAELQTDPSHGIRLVEGKEGDAYR
jgi:predicted nucleic-acid-binding Zn-ribbon protein